MKSIEVDVRDLVKMAKVIVALTDTYDNEETVKGCYDLNDAFKAEVRDLYIKSNMTVDEKNFMCHISRDLRNKRIVEIMAIHEDDDDEDE